ncbi:MAG: M56 family metallopeptidase [Anaeromyxobacter sp.]
MTSATWAEYLAQSIFHALVASLVVEALVRAWRVVEPRQRMGLRLLGVALPLFVSPALMVLFPVRATEAFRRAAALFEARRWDDLRWLGMGLMGWWVLAMAGAGLALLLVDLVPYLRRRSGPRRAETPLAAARAAALEGLVRPLSAGLALAPPRIVHLGSDLPLLYCTGLRRPALVVSRGALALLDPGELRAAVAHELCHLAHRDPVSSWALFLARGLLAFNPAFQVVARVLMRDAESLADERAAELTGDRLALASAVLRLYRAGAGVTGARTLPFAAALARVRAADVELRCRRLLEPAPAPLPFGFARVVLGGLAVTGLLFFVV